MTPDDIAKELGCIGEKREALVKAINLIYNEGAKAGYTIANLWLSVEDELYPDNTDIQIKDDEGNVFIGACMTGTVYQKVIGTAACKSAYHPTYTHITHWKPIVK